MEDLDFIKASIYTYQSGPYSAKATKETFKDFPMFDKITFRDKGGLPFVDFSFNINGKKYTYDREFKRWFSVTNINIFCFEVFVFTDNFIEPLLVRVKNRNDYYYYRIRESIKLNDCLKLNTPYLYSSTQFFEALIQENEKINKTITFQIDKKHRYNNIDLNTDYLNEFSAYKHIPKEPYKSFSPVVLKGKIRVPLDKINLNHKDKNFDYMIVYYRDKVPHSSIPLLIEFSCENKKYYFGKEKIYQKHWSEVEIVENENLESELDDIETFLIYSVPVSIHMKTHYTKNFTQNDITPKNFDGILESIKVKKDNKWSNLYYVCYEHDFRVYNKPITKKKQYKFGDTFKALFINISNITIEITYDNTESGIFLNEQNTKLYVWFYKNSTKTDDNLPLMVQYNNQIYTPKSKEEYLDKWVEVPGISDILHNDVKLKNELDKVNFMLNTIDLNHKIEDTSESFDYGIPRPPDLNDSFDAIRILVQYESYKKLFCKYTHRAKNGYKIGEAHYTKLFYNQRGTQTKREHDSIFNENNKPKNKLNVESSEVTAYYFKYDLYNEYPLMVEYKLLNGQFQYYVLQCEFTQDAEYTFTSLSLGNPIEDNDLFTILRHQNFIFHNGINIKLDKHSAYTCCDSLKKCEYLTFAKSGVRGPESCRFKHETSSVTKNLPFIEVTEFNKQLLYGYVVYEHILTTFLANNIRVPGGTKLDFIKIQGFQINNSEINLIDSPLEVGVFVRTTCVYVYFYGLDPRPLLVCYNRRIYAPKDKSGYESVWYPVKGVKTFMSRSERYSNSLDPIILNKLNDAVCFLNTVNLYEHNGSGNHKYTVHRYNGQDVEINVKSENVSPSPNSSSFSCYKKLTHTPNGINGKNHNGYRLGNVEYRNKELTGKLDYNEGIDKRYPLTSVTVYYYNHDKKYKDPLLVELQFDNNSKRLDTSTEYYKLISNDKLGIKWKKDNRAFYDVKLGGDDLLNHLDEIRYGLKKVFKVELGKQAPYNLMLSQNIGESYTFHKANDYQVLVEESTNCPKLSNNVYKTFIHKISSINKNFDYNLIGGIQFSLPFTNGYPIEISLNDSKSSKSVGNLNYNKCMGDVYVYFFLKSEPYEQVPLFFYFNNKWYMPSSIKEYFRRWSIVDNLQAELKLSQLGYYRQITEYVIKANISNQVDRLGKYSIELTTSVSGKDIEAHTGYDLETPYVEIDQPYDNYMENPPVDLETVSDDDTEIPNDNYMENPPVDLETFSEDDSEIPYAHIKRPYLDFEVPSRKVFQPQILYFEPQYIEKAPSIREDQQEDQLNNDAIFQVLDVKQDYDTHVKILEDSEKDLEPKILGQEESYTGSMPIAMASTGQVHGSQSDESNQSYLGSILGGTFGSLITIGLFTFMLLKYFRKVKIRNMIPIIY